MIIRRETLLQGLAWSRVKGHHKVSMWSGKEGKEGKDLDYSPQLDPIRK